MVLWIIHAISCRRPARRIAIGIPIRVRAIDTAAGKPLQGVEW